MSITPIEQFEFTPHCPECGMALAYRVNPHDNPDCSLKNGVYQSTHGVKWQNSVEQIICQLYSQYPGSYGRHPYARWRILDHIFVTVGNGMTWKNGQIILILNLESPSLVQYKPSLYSYEKECELYRAGKYEEVNELIKLYDLEREGTETYFYTPEDLAQHTSEPRFFSYVSKSSLIMQIPRNVKPDWLQATQDMCNILDYQPAIRRNNQIDPYYNLDWIDRIQSRIDEVSRNAK
jgi:hypothetical protein